MNIIEQLVDSVERAAVQKGSYGAFIRGTPINKNSHIGELVDTYQALHERLKFALLVEVERVRREAAE
jgi:hypothetical protein